MIGAERGYKVKIVMPCDMSQERKILLKMFGAELIEVDEGDFEQAINLKDEIVKQKGYFSLNQFDNPLNIECHYKTTFKELLSHSLTIGKYISAFISGTGTGGTIMGVQKGFSEFDTRVKMIAVEPAESPVMSGGEKGLHGIQGIGDGSQFLVDLNKINEIITISTNDAKERCKSLALDNGLLVGISAGANILAAERWVEKNKPEGIVFTILCDRGERYCSMLY
jgi:cysteine synthase A